MPPQGVCVGSSSRQNALRLFAASRSRLEVGAQMRSEGPAPRQTKPDRHVSGPQAPPPGCRRDGWRAFSVATVVRSAEETQAASPEEAARPTYPAAHV